MHISIYSIKKDSAAQLFTLDSGLQDQCVLPASKRHSNEAVESRHSRCGFQACKVPILTSQAGAYLDSIVFSHCTIASSPPIPSLPSSKAVSGCVRQTVVFLSANHVWEAAQWRF